MEWVAAGDGLVFGRVAPGRWRLLHRPVAMRQWSAPSRSRTLHRGKGKPARNRGNLCCLMTLVARRPTLSADWRQREMPRYTFEVSAGPTVLIREAGVELADRNAVWTHIAGLAFATGEAGARVTVRDGRDEIVVCIGLWTVRNLVRKPAAA